MIDVFNHLVALISIILSLGIANLVAFVATLVHRQKKVRLDAPQLLWAATIFLSQIEFWLSVYPFRTLSAPDVPTILFVILVPVLHYLQAVLVVPEYQPGAVMDLRRHHEENFREYIGVGVLLSLLTMAYLAWMMGKHPGFVLPGAFIVGSAFALTGLIAMVFRNRWVQVLMPLTQLGLRIVFLPALVATMNGA